MTVVKTLQDLQLVLAVFMICPADPSDTLWLWFQLRQMSKLLIITNKVGQTKYDSLPPYLFMHQYKLLSSASQMMRFMRWTEEE